jgi:hypothetical protein
MPEPTTTATRVDIPGAAMHRSSPETTRRLDPLRKLCSLNLVSFGQYFRAIALSGQTSGNLDQISVLRLGWAAPHLIELGVGEYL